MSEAQQSELDRNNSTFWDTLCGSQLAQTLGVADFSLASLQKFDAYYFGFYPYLLEHVPLDSLWGKDVLEVGLGYGTLSQTLAAVGRYSGLDIAEGPVNVVNERLKLVGLEGHAVQGSILEPPFNNESFDAVITIGCLHHTGNMPLAFRRIHDLLRPGGRFVFMVYNAFSYRRWQDSPRDTLRFFIRDLFGGDMALKGNSLDRAAYDTNDSGEGAPHTEFCSARQLRRLLHEFVDIRVVRENAQPEGHFKDWTRTDMRRWISPWSGLDLYVSARKA